MFRTRLLVTCVFLICASHAAFGAQCESTPPKRLNLTQFSTSSLPSPDHRWEFQSISPNAPDKEALLYIWDAETSKKWLLGSIGRNGTAFWSKDSKRLFLRDEYEADDTRIRIFDLTGTMPHEIKDLNDKIEEVLIARIPKDKATQWVYFPDVCFSEDSSTIIILADAPLVPKEGSGSGKSFDLKLTVNVVTRRVLAAVQTTR